MKKEMTRKEFLQSVSAAGLALLGGGALLNSCGGGGKEEQSGQSGMQEQSSSGMADQGSAAQDTSCNDLSGLTDAEIQMRENLKYVDKSPYPDKLCDNCELYIPAKEGELCGGCKILKGPIHPKGHCTSWSPKVS